MWFARVRWRKRMQNPAIDLVEFHHVHQTLWIKRLLSPNAEKKLHLKKICYIWIKNFCIKFSSSRYFLLVAAIYWKKVYKQRWFLISPGRIVVGRVILRPRLHSRNGQIAPLINIDLKLWKVRALAILHYCRKKVGDEFCVTVNYLDDFHQGYKHFI